MISSCPICGGWLDTDPDGGYCKHCDEYFLSDALHDFEEEEGLTGDDWSSDDEGYQWREVDE